VYSARLPKLGKAVLRMLRGLANTLKHASSSPAAQRFWRLVEKNAAIGLEKIKRIVTLSTVMAVLAIVLFVSIVLGYI
jgi:hypothetical protein